MKSLTIEEYDFLRLVNSGFGPEIEVGSSEEIIAERLVKRQIFRWQDLPDEPDDENSWEALIITDLGHLAMRVSQPAIYAEVV